MTQEEVLQKMGKLRKADLLLLLEALMKSSDQKLTDSLGSAAELLKK